LQVTMNTPVPMQFK